MKNTVRPALALTALLIQLITQPALAAAQAHAAPGTSSVQGWFSVVEIPALLVAVVFGFLTARALRGGKLGTGMTLIAWGFLVMAIGHLHMQADIHFGFNLFNVLFGGSIGPLVWFIALVVTWTLTGLGFYKLYRAGSGA